MNNLLNAGQVELGNVILAENYRGERVSRRLVGGTYGTVTKYFLIDEETFELKSRKRDTIEEVLDGFKIVGIIASGKVVEGTKKDNYELGDLFLAIVDGKLVTRQIVGGQAYSHEGQEPIYFAIDVETGKRCSRTRTSIEEVLKHYEVEMILG